jgi:hypothetical protein
MMRSFLIASASGLLLSHPAVAALGPPVCDNRDLIVQRLGTSYEEVAQSVGLDSNGNVLEIFVSPEGTWTALVTNPKGVACIVAAGEAWEQLAPLRGHLS